MTKPILKIQDLRVNFGEDVQAVKGVSFDLHPNETLAIVGESGSGKSVSALSILKLLPYPKASHPSGQILYAGRDMLKLKEAELNTIRGSEISMIFQEPMTSLNPLHTIEAQLAEMVNLHLDLKPDQVRTRILDLLHKVQIPDPETRLSAYPHELSGGQRQRIMIAMALICHPKILIADEPTTALDVTTEAEILQLIADLKAEFGMSVIFITHDLNVVRRISDRVVVMKDGTVQEQGQTKDIFSKPKVTYTKALLAAEPEGAPAPIAKHAQPVIAAKDLKIHFPIRKGLLRRTVDYVRAVDGVSFEVKAGETLGIVGESGSGKTTLGQGLLQLIETQGEIVFNGQRLDALTKSKLRNQRADLQFVFQDPFGSLNPRYTVADCIGEGATFHNIARGKALDDLVCETLTKVGLDPAVRHRYPHEFSGGQRQRISIARSLVLNPKLMVLDEPTSALDRTVQKSIINLLRDLQKDLGLSYIFISHDLKVIQAMSHKIMVLKQGKVVDYAETNQLLKDPRHPYTKTLLAAAFAE